MPIIERTAGKVKGRGRGRSRRVGVVSASPSAQGVSVSSIKRKHPTDHHDIGDCEQARSVVPGKLAFSSDHHPILITSDIPHDAINRLPKGRRRFQFEEAWTTEAACNEVVRQSWQSMVEPIHNIANCASRLTRWSAQKFGQVPRTVKELRVRLGNLQSEPSSTQNFHSHTMSDYDKIRAVFVEFYNNLFKSNAGVADAEIFTAVKT
ncbi:uncharacterized protein Pyn_22612 [Prunus yedoensis var. nudiflora]|uniref:Uncharacterized protein n=1 Tax=Prunus yedoensis var. nudiflora TaxID=2094558 RepID=A0A314ZRW6_PRUYE|nr:uncharacterized protein Pyn_22612 [Prunus yedoensis var. nudiflora]